MMLRVMVTSNGVLLPRRTVMVTLVPDRRAGSHDLGQPHALRALAVDRDDQIARLHAGLLGRRAVDRRDHLRHAVLRRDLDAEPAELAGDVGLRLLVFLLVHVVGMRIEPVEHALERIVGERRRVDRVHVVALHELDDAADQGEVRG